MVPASKRDMIVTKTHQKIIKSVRDRGYNQPFISFPKGLAEGLVPYCDNVDIACIGLDPSNRYKVGSRAYSLRCCFTG